MNSPLFLPFHPVSTPVTTGWFFPARQDSGFGCMPAVIPIGYGMAMQPGSLSATPDGHVQTPGGYSIDTMAQPDGGRINITAPDGQTSTIWGDPHFAQNGQQVFDFNGTTTFTLPDNTKLTVRTQQNPNGTWSSSGVTITNGSSGVSYNNLIGNPGGMSMSTGYGPMMDAMTYDGNELYLGRDNVVRGLNGYGGMSRVDQRYINDTDDVMNPFGASRKDALSALQEMLANAFGGNFLANYGGFNLMSSFQSPMFPSFGSFGFSFMPSLGMWQPAF